MSRLNAIFHTLDNRMNPIVVKELRQTSRGKFLIVILLGFLFTQLTVTGLVSFTVTGPAPGPELFKALLGFLTGTCALLIPAYAGFRLANERADANVDLLFSTALKPVSIIWGKTLSAGILTAMIYSVCMPFIVMTYMLRGIDLQLSFQLLAISFIFVFLSTQLGILIGSMPGNRIIKGIIGLFALFTIFGFLMGGVGFMAASGLGGVDIFSFLTTAEGLWTTAGIIVGGILMSAALFLVSTAFVSPPSSNRAFTPRIFMTALWAFSLAIVFVWSEMRSTEIPIAVWMFVFIGIFWMALIMSVSERDRFGLRVRRKIPRTGAARAIAFLFYSGSAGGFLWSSIGIVLTILIGSLAIFSSSGAMPSNVVESTLYILAFYSFNYWISALGAVLLHRYPLKKHIPGIYTWLIAVGINMITGMLWGVYMIGARMSGGMGPFSIFDSGGEGSQITIVSGVIALILGVACLPWMARQMAAFKPYGRQEARRRSGA